MIHKLYNNANKKKQIYRSVKYRNIYWKGKKNDQRD